MSFLSCCCFVSCSYDASWEEGGLRKEIGPEDRIIDGKGQRACSDKGRKSKKGQETVMRLTSCAAELVIFFSSFIALRSHDNSHPIAKFDDHKIHHENMIFEA